MYDDKGKAVNSWRIQSSRRQTKGMRKVVDLSSLAGLDVLDCGGDKMAHLKLVAPGGSRGAVMSENRRRRGDEHRRLSMAAKSVREQLQKSSVSDSETVSTVDSDCVALEAKEEVVLLGDTRQSGVRFGGVTVCHWTRPRYASDRMSEGSPSQGSQSVGSIGSHGSRGSIGSRGSQGSHGSHGSRGSHGTQAKGKNGATRSSKMLHRMYILRMMQKQATQAKELDALKVLQNGIRSWVAKARVRAMREEEYRKTRAMYEVGEEHRHACDLDLLAISLGSEPAVMQAAADFEARQLELYGGLKQVQAQLAASPADYGQQVRWTRAFQALTRARLREGPLPTRPSRDVRSRDVRSSYETGPHAAITARHITDAPPTPHGPPSIDVPPLHPRQPSHLPQVLYLSPTPPSGRASEQSLRRRGSRESSAREGGRSESDSTAAVSSPSHALHALHLERTVWADRVEVQGTLTPEAAFDTNEVFQRMLDRDWSHASRAHGLEWWILNRQLPLRAKADATTTSSRWAMLRAVHDIFWRYRAVVYGTFEYLATIHTVPARGASERDGLQCDDEDDVEAPSSWALRLRRGSYERYDHAPSGADTKRRQSIMATEGPGRPISPTPNDTGPMDPTSPAGSEASSLRQRGGSERGCSLPTHPSTRQLPPRPNFVIGSDAFFDHFVHEFHLLSPACTIDDVEAIFDFVQSAEEACGEKRPTMTSHKMERTLMRRSHSTHPTGVLSRAAWLEILVRLAVKRCGQLRSSGSTEDGQGSAEGRAACNVATALEQFCRKVLARHFPAQVLEGLPPGQSSNQFRILHCFSPPTSKFLAKHQPLCRTLFAEYAQRSVDGGEPAVMTIGGWLAFVDDLVLLDSKLLSLPQARFIFLRSRIRTCPAAKEQTRSGVAGVEHELTLRCHLDFMDWLEALVRLSMAVAIPATPRAGASANKAWTEQAYDFLRGLRQVAQR